MSVHDAIFFIMKIEAIFIVLTIIFDVYMCVKRRIYDNSLMGQDISGSNSTESVHARGGDLSLNGAVVTGSHI
jgi:hypothetical protein